MRGGISQCSHRYSKANNKYMQDYNPELLSVFLLYVDVNSMYAWAMTQYLPLCNFEWMDKSALTIEEILQTADDAPIGYILEVDIKYPVELHDEHSDYPLCAEHMIIPNSVESKLLLTLSDKMNYVLHYRTLKLVVAQGLIIEKIHKIIRFKQSPWLKQYIELNINERSKAKNDFDKNLFKLMSNAIYGKSMENVRNRSIVKLRDKWEGRFGVRNLISKPTFKNLVIFNEDFVAVEMNRCNIFMNRPVIVGASILEISKLKMYEFHYNFMKVKFQNNCKILYTDTDSFIYEIKCEDVYKTIIQNVEKFDTSDYPPNNVYGIPLLNKKELGLMKDENNGKIMTEFIGLRSKMYATRVENSDCTKKIKGVKKNVIKKSITFNDYLKCLNENTIITHNQNLIRNKLHKVYSTIQSKIALSPFDNKRFILDDKISTIPWGHYSINETN